MKGWVAAVLLLAIYCAVAEGTCGGSSGSNYEQGCPGGATSFTTSQPYQSCHTRWWRRRCNTRYRVVTKYTRTYYCNADFRLIGSSCYRTEIPCGISKYPNAGAQYYYSANIVGGTPALTNEFPWQVRLDLSGALCGGTILNSTTILTAAHCVRGKITSGMRVHAGDHERTKTDYTEQVHTVSSVLIHPNYNPGTIYNDVALLTLTVPLLLNANVRAACLPSKAYSVTNKDVVISGWGRLSTSGSIPNVLKYAVVRVVNQTVCRESYGWVGEDLLCVSDGRGDKVRSACFGDSGGPMVIKSEGKWIVVGVASYVHTNGCAAGEPFGYKSVMFHYDFIRYGRVTQVAG